ncbi:MAG: glycoside hydrolase family 13 protein [Firmicutes bacterium]|nr:glycoside hydrolase family 13 protein [Bacillota bacterium]MDY5676407.1 glycoside hydrolase family 13 protein [Eubacteriales bacterium]
MENFVFNPINNKLPKGACAKGSNVSYTLKVAKFIGLNLAYFVMHKDGENDTRIEMTKDHADERYFYMTCSVKYDDPGFYWYHFEVETSSGNFTLVRDDDFNLKMGPGGNNYLQLVIASESSVAKNFRKGIIYHIFVDRFCRSGQVTARKGLKLIDDWSKPIELEYNEAGERVNFNCYGGNFQGIIDKLSYLKSLNVGTIYLSPIMEANSNHKYDVADYSKIDSMFGDQELFETLIAKAKRLGMTVIIDGVFNHTGSDSVYFNKNGRYRTVGAYQSPNSKYYSWYTFNKYPDDYSCWWGIKTLPQTEENSGFFDYIAGRNGIIEKYMAMGIGGYRLDVVDELTNNFLHAICQAARRVNPKAMIIGEVWEDASSKISYDERKNYFLGGNLDSVTNYPMKNAILDFVKHGDVKTFVNTINLIKDQYPKAIQNNLMNILDTHDTARALTYLGLDDGINPKQNISLTPEQRDRAKKLLKLATIMQYTVMGIPTVFYGDEAGLEGTGDPYCRATYPWGSEDSELVEWYKQLGELRNNPVFANGELDIKYAQDGVVAYERGNGDFKAIIIINRGKKPFEFTLMRTMSNYFTNEHISGKITVPCDEALVLI